MDRSCDFGVWSMQVHVFDVCQALWHVTTAGEDSAVYNLADANDTSAFSTR
jgi:dTDP-D-glucose 4,6-dehydratase